MSRCITTLVMTPGASPSRGSSASTCGGPPAAPPRQAQPASAQRCGRLPAEASQKTAGAPKVWTEETAAAGRSPLCTISSVSTVARLPPRLCPVNATLAPGPAQARCSCTSGTMASYIDMAASYTPLGGGGGGGGGEGMGS
jgi:hypothetical protein